MTEMRMTLTLFAVLALASALALPPTPALASFVMWTGEVSSEWTNPANWDIGRVPTAMDDVLIPDDLLPSFDMPTIDGISVTVDELVVEGRLTIAGSVNLTVGNIYVVGGSGVDEGVIALGDGSGPGHLTLHGPGGFDVQDGGIVEGDGDITTVGAVRMSVEDNYCAFDVPLIVGSGIATASTPSGAELGSVSVSPGATLQLTSSGLAVTGDLTNSGTIAGNGVLSYTGPAFTNNGAVTLAFIHLGPGVVALSGIGSFSGGRTTIEPGLVNLISDHQMGEVWVDPGGIFNLTGHTLSLSAGGSALRCNGTCTLTGSTIVYNGTAPQSAASLGYHNLTVSNTAGVSLSVGSVLNRLTLASGALSGGTNLTLLDGSTVSRGAGQLSAAPVFAGVVDLEYTGSTGVTTGPELPGSASGLDDLTIANSGGVALAQNATVYGTLTLTSGILNVGSTTLTVHDGSVATSGSLSSAADGTVIYDRVAGSQTVLPGVYGNLELIDSAKELPPAATITVNGNLSLNTDLTTGSSGAVVMGSSATSAGFGDVLGRVTRFAPFATDQAYSYGNPLVQIGFSAGGTQPADLSVVLAKSSPPELPGAISRTYSITPNGGSGYSATVRLRYEEEELGLISEESLRLWRYDGGSSNWVAQGKTGADLADNWVELSGVGAFSDWAIASASSTYDYTWTDDFATPWLHPLWSWVRDDPSHWSLSDSPGSLRITTQTGGLFGPGGNQNNILLAAAPSGDYQITTTLSINPTENFQYAGIHVYQDDDNYVQLNRAYANGDTVNFDIEIGGVPTSSQVSVAATSLYLRIVRHEDSYVGFYSTDGAGWTQVGTGTADLTSPSVGLLAANNLVGVTEIPADFDSFHLEADFPVFDNTIQDEFGASALGAEWSWINENPALWSLTENPGSLRLRANAGGVGTTNLLIQNAPAGDFGIQTRLLFEPTANYQIAGLVLFQDSSDYLMLGRAHCDDPAPACVGNGLYFDNIEGGVFLGNFATPASSEGDAILRVIREEGTFSAFYSEDYDNWFLIGRHTRASPLEPLKIGLTSAQDFGMSGVAADFDSFSVAADGFKVFLPLVKRNSP